MKYMMQMNQDIQKEHIHKHGVSPQNENMVIKVIPEQPLLEFINSVGIEAIHAHEMMLMQRFYDGVRDVDGVTFYGNFTRDRAPIVTLNIGDIPSGEVADILSDEFSIATRAGAHCAPRLHTALGTVEQGAVRFSFGYYNTVEDVDAAIAAVRSIAL